MTRISQNYTGSMLATEDSTTNDVYDNATVDNDINATVDEDEKLLTDTSI